MICFLLFSLVLGTDFFPLTGSGTREPSVRFGSGLPSETRLLRFDGTMTAPVLVPVLPVLLLLRVSPVCPVCPGHPARYCGWIAENSPAGSPVAGVALPVGTGGCRRADLRAGLKGDHAADFRLVRRGGRPVLVSSRPLDRESVASYRLTVELPSPCRSGAVGVRVEVSDRNDNVPRFAGGNQTVDADELTPLGTELAQFRARDDDAGRNGRVTVYAMPESHLLHVVPGSGQVRLVGSLVGVTRVTLRLSARDGGDPALRSDPVFLRVTVSRSGGARRTPRALTEEPAHTVTVPDHVTAGAPVFTVPDRRFERRRFELEAGADPPVRVEPDTGRLLLARALREPAEVRVRVRNLRGEQSYLCRLMLLPSHHAALRWNMFPLPYLGAVGPDAAPGSVVYHLSARQQHDAPGPTQFFLLDGGEESFEVDRRSGDIRTTGRPLTPSREYVMHVQAVDGRGHKSPPAAVAILAGQRPPQFTNATYSLRVPETTPTGQSVGVVHAVSFQNKRVSYVLLLNPGGVFNIDQEGGALSLAQTVDYETGHALFTLQVRAIEADTDLSGVTEVVVHITDENDCTPEFHHAIYARDNVPESVAMGASLLQVLARDCDSGVNSDLSYFVVSDDFDITSGGVVSPARRLDYERSNHAYEFVVVAVDAGEPPRTGTASVRIRVSNSNDEAPAFSQSAYHTFLSEDAGPGTLVAIVHANDPDGDAISYAITGGNEDNNFLLDHQKGVIRLRRSPAPRLRGLRYVLNITATDDNASGGPHPLSSSAQVVVGINDVNDNKPLFQECENSSLQAGVLENQPPGTAVLRVRALDADMGVNGEVQYGLVGRGGASPGFAIDPDTGVITTTASFDRERQREFTLTVTATDRAAAPLIGVCRITVAIGDQNDNDPKFENSRYQYFLREDTPIGTSFLRAAAHDDDLGSNAAITYSLSNQTPAYLQINPSTGWIYVHAPISQTSRIVQQVVASDGGNRSSSVELTVTITNVHNQPPLWEQQEYRVSIPEDTPRDATVVIIKATSPLGDPRVTYDLEEGQVPETNLPVRFYVRPNRADGSAALLVAERLDHETTPLFTLRVRVQNVAAVPLASFATVYVNVTDVNDNVPFFLSSSYEATVPEGVEPGTPVVQVSAADLDSGRHGTVRYALLRDPSGDAHFFSIDAQSGVVTTRATFDREQKASYLIEVQSEDGAESARPGHQGHPNTDTAPVRILVTDVNDNAPAFPQNVYEVSVGEDEEVGVALITVTANDEDEGANARLRYQLTSGNAMGAFGVQPEVGVVFVARPLDYETRRLYEIRLVASDGKWENEALLVVQVLNRNDEAPVFTQSEYHAPVWEELSQLPALILQVGANDPDYDADQTALRYSLRGQGAGDEFSIDERSGRIYGQQRLDREDRPSWRLLVLATDEGGAGLTGFADVFLEVRDINDNAPFFPCPALQMDGCFVGRVPENSPADTAVMEMRALDLDDAREGGNAALTYRIVQNARDRLDLELFAINGSTGAVRTTRRLDREAQAQHLLLVEARDGGGLAGTGTATITVTDVNDHPPLFTQTLYTAQVGEDLPVNSEVVVVSVTDEDEGENAQVTFSIVGGDEDRRFFVETDRVTRRGVVRLQKALDFEKPQERTFNLTLRADDAHFSSVTSCLVQVEDANDHTPVFYPQFIEAAAVSEDVPLGTRVAQVTASDRDSGVNGRVSYSVAPPSDPHAQFLVDRSGWVLVGGALDREKASQHRIAVLATDAGTPPLTGTAVVMVTVLDVNDNGPEWEAAYRPVVWENSAAPQAVRMNETSLLLHAVDRDSAPNGGPFAIQLLPLTADATSFNLTDIGNGSATVTALRTFDRERQSEYRLPILMTDSGSPPISSTATLTVVIGDRNDHPHSSGHTHFIVYSHEGAPPPTLLGLIPSPDPDDCGEKVYRFQGNPPRWFGLNQSSGELSIMGDVPQGSYDLRVGVADPPWPEVTSTARVEVRQLSQEALQNSASICLRNLSVEQFFSGGGASPFSRLGRGLADLLGTLPANVHVFSVGVASRRGLDLLDVWFAAHGSPFYRREKLLGYVAAHKAKLEAVVGVSITQVGVDDCAFTDCSVSGGCSRGVTFSRAPAALSSGNTTLVSLTATPTARCGCRARQVTRSPCSAYPHNPCLNGGTCQDGPLGHRCACPPTFDGPECQLTKRSFSGRGYAWFPPIMPCFQSHISLEFLAESANGLLLYNGPLGPAHSSELEDFISIQLRDGAPVLNINHGSGTLSLKVLPTSTVTDHRWHRLDVRSNGKAVQLTLDQCEGAAASEGGGGVNEEGGGVHGHETNQSSCSAAGETPGTHRYLNVFQPLQVGGVKETSHRRFHGFSGCIRNLVVDSQVYDLASPSEGVASAPGCGLRDGVCVTPRGPSCGVRASCHAHRGSFSCECDPGFTGRSCDGAVPEFSFGSGAMARYQLGGGVSRRSSVQLLLRTRAALGTLLAVTSQDGGDYIILEIVGGHLAVRAHLGDGGHALQLPAHRVDLGQWLLVRLSRHDNQFTLQLEQGGGSQEVQAWLGGHRQVVFRPSSVTVGAGPDAGGDYQGCLRDVRLDGQLLPLDEAPPGGGPLLVLERRGIVPGCHSDACSAQPCPSPMRCVDLWRKHQCRCATGQVTAAGASGQWRCVPSPCDATSCLNGGVCLATAADSYRCRCPDGVRGQRCELGGVKGQRLALLSPSSILAISMGLLVFFAVLVAVTVWNQKGSRNKFRRGGVYHLPPEHQSWEEVLENILNHNEEGGGEQDQNGYDITELQCPAPVPLITPSPGSQEGRHPSGPSYLSIPRHHGRPRQHAAPGGTAHASHALPGGSSAAPWALRSHLDFQSCVSRIVWEADHAHEAFPLDAYHVWCMEGAGSSTGSLSSLGSAPTCGNHGDREEDEGGVVPHRLSQWGPKFQALSDMYDPPHMALEHRGLLPHHH
ncbi:neural-cadherin [Antennarius striatus]|uniref:neural-cadherin n=1 Tax=Antennarius striatus TaxID=241820 RepID=UPI0035B33353